jgi:multiple sugar transport system substrate-binding protein
VPNVPNSIEIWQTFRDAYSASVIFDKSEIDDELSGASDKVTELAGQS